MSKLFAGIWERTIDLRPRSRAEFRRWTTLCHHQGRYIFWDNNICKILEFVMQQYLKNVNLGELQIFVIYKYFKNINKSYPWISFYFPLRLEATRSISTESESTGNDISIRWIWSQTRENNFFKIFVPTNHSVIKFLPNICSSKIIQSSNFFKIFVPPKYYYNQISFVHLPPNYSITKCVPNIFSSKIIQSSNIYQFYVPPNH